MGTIKLSLIFVVVLGVVLGGFYLYFNWSQDRIQSLQLDNARLTTAVEEQKKAIEAQQEFDRKQNDNLAELQVSLQQANDAKSALEEKFLKHDLESLARKDPKAIERRINAATDKAFRDIESFTGAATRPLAVPSKGCTPKKDASCKAKSPAEPAVIPPPLAGTPKPANEE